MSVPALMLTPRDLARALQSAARHRFTDVEVTQIERDENENEWRADYGNDQRIEHVNFHVKVGGRDFLVTVEDITFTEH